MPPKYSHLSDGDCTKAEATIPENRLVCAKDFNGDFHHRITSSGNFKGRLEQSVNELLEATLDDFLVDHPEEVDDRELRKEHRVSLTALDVINFTSRVQRRLKAAPSTVIGGTRAQMIRYLTADSEAKGDDRHPVRGMVSLLRIKRKNKNWVVTDYRLYTYDEFADALKQKGPEGLTNIGDLVLSTRVTFNNVTKVRDTREMVVVPARVAAYIGLGNLRSDNIFVARHRLDPKVHIQMGTNARRTQALAKADRARLDWLNDTVKHGGGLLKFRYQDNRFSLWRGDGSVSPRTQSIRSLMDKEMTRDRDKKK